jgi:hypothetical protein
MGAQRPCPPPSALHPHSTLQTEPQLQPTPTYTTPPCKPNPNQPQPNPAQTPPYPPPPRCGARARSRVCARPPGPGTLGRPPASRQTWPRAAGWDDIDMAGPHCTLAGAVGRRPAGALFVARQACLCVCRVMVFLACCCALLFAMDPFGTLVCLQSCRGIRQCTIDLVAFSFV